MKINYVDKLDKYPHQRGFIRVDQVWNEIMDCIRVLQDIIDRHPDSPVGEHPTVDMARAVIEPLKAKVNAL